MDAPEDGVTLPFLKQSDWRSRWLMTPRGDRLHRVKSLVDYARWDAWPQGMQGETVCGIKGPLGMPGILSRMGRTRCSKCCQKLGLPQGDGAPFNAGLDA